jgi:hypothetical protein
VGGIYDAEQDGDHLFLLYSRQRLDGHWTGMTEEVMIVFERDATTGTPIAFPHSVRKDWYYGPLSTKVPAPPAEQNQQTATQPKQDIPAPREPTSPTEADRRTARTTWVRFPSGHP